MESTCDKCGKVFNVTFKEKHHPNKVTETYFKCKHCKHHYTCFVKDDDVRKMQKEIKTIDSPFIRLGLQRKINTRMKKIKGDVQRG